MSKEYSNHNKKADVFYQAQEGLMEFFKAMVPLELRKGFKELSLKHYRGLAINVYQQKENLHMARLGVSRKVFNNMLEKYLEDSKRLIRMVMYKELGLQVDDKKTALDSGSKTDSLS